MKKTILIALASTFSLVSLSQESATTKENKPKKEKTHKKKTKSPIKFDTYVIERKGITNGADETFSFEFKNNGKIPVMISDIKTSCGCTTAEKPTAPIEPGKKGVIAVKYDTKRVGEFTKEIKVITNIQVEPIILMIKGSVNPEGTVH